MMQFSVTERWHTTFAGGHVGVLLLNGIDNHKRPTALDQEKAALLAELRERYAGSSRADLLEIPVLQAYRRYYKQFKKTYHVQLQLESIVQKGKGLPSVNPLVDAYFSAEMQTLVLTAGHDADLLTAPITIDATQAGDTMQTMNGKQQTVKENDMTMRCGDDIICTILYGQDQRTPITHNTHNALFVAYAPAGVPAETVAQQFSHIEANVRLFAPNVSVGLNEIFTAGEH